jgi:hypothetical protein
MSNIIQFTNSNSRFVKQQSSRLQSIWDWKNDNIVTFLQDIAFYRPELDSIVLETAQKIDKFNELNIFANSR